MDLTLVAIDFETANSEPCSACAVGLIAVRDGKTVFEYESLIKPPKEYSEFQYFNSKIHGIQRDEVKDEQTWEKIYPNLKPYLENSIIIAHNAMFDLRVLKCLNDYYQLDIPNAQYFCTVELSQKWLKNLENHKLNTVSEHLKVPLNHHNAKSDAIACMAIVQHALKDKNVVKVEELLDEFEMTLGKL